MSLAEEILAEFVDYQETVAETAAIVQETLEAERFAEEQLAQQRSENELAETVAYEEERKVRALRPIKMLEMIWDYQAAPYLNLRDRCEKIEGAIMAFMQDIEADRYAPTYTRQLMTELHRRSLQPDKMIKLLYSQDYNYFFLLKLRYAIQYKIVRGDKSFYRWAKNPVLPFDWKNWRHWARLWQFFSDRYLQELPDPNDFDSPDDPRFAPMLYGFSSSPLQPIIDEQLALQSAAQESEQT